MRQLRWGVSGFAVVGALFAVTSMTAAVATPPFTATPSYATYGGFAIVGHSSVTAIGSGSNTIGTAPHFTVATGADRQAESSSSSGSGKHAMEVFSGVQNVSFVCGGPNCANGTYITSIEWNASWYAHIGTNCPANSSGSTLYSTVALGIFASVIDQSTSPITVAGTVTLTLFSHNLYSSGSMTNMKISHLYLLKFKTTLVKGDSYTIQTYFEAYAYTVAASPAGAVCSSTASESVGVHHPSVLEWIKVS
jgi:hypothetical protein